MISQLRCFTAAVALGLFACSSSSSSDPASGAGGPTGTSTTTGSGTTGSGGSSGGAPKCGAGALSETNLGIVGSVGALLSDGTNLFYSAVPDARNGDVTGKPDHIAKLAVAGGTPTILASADSGAALSSLAIDEQNVFFVLSDVGLAKIPKAGGTPTSLAMVGGIFLALEFAVDATTVYYDNRGAITKVSKEGGTPTEIWKDADISPSSIVSDGDDLYFVGSPPISFEPDAAPRERPSVYRLPKAGGALTKVTQVASDPSLHESIWHLAVDGANLVYSTIIDPDMGSIDVAIYSVPKAGGTAVKLAQGGAAFTAQGGTVYYADYSKIKKVPVGGGTPVDLGVDAPDGTGAMGLDATNVYWESRGCIYKAAR